MNELTIYDDQETSRDKKIPSDNNNVTVYNDDVTEEYIVVCGDKGYGYHYNALICEGCTHFFDAA